MGDLDWIYLAQDGNKWQMWK